MNAWYFGFYLPLKSHSVELVNEVLGPARRAGFSLNNSYSGIITGFSLDGDEQNFPSEESAVAFLAKECGLLNLWKGEDRDISISFNPRNKTQLMDVKIYIENVFFREYTPDRIAIAKENLPNLS